MRHDRRRRAGRERERSPCKGAAAESQVIVDGGCRGRGRVERRAAARVRGGSPGELRRDRRPRTVGITPVELDAAKARAEPGLDERTDGDAALVVDDGEVGHVAP
ncbi:hypothetical protein GCM10009747_25460 [Agromyces humatus]|uniref:Uncharacterized protein n=1 Tax=Agromyces humatus TaxID=279573 RepID=A0ABN2KRZ8_9MICO